MGDKQNDPGNMLSHLDQTVICYKGDQLDKIGTDCQEANFEGTKGTNLHTAQISEGTLTMIQTTIPEKGDTMYIDTESQGTDERGRFFRRLIRLLLIIRKQSSLLIELLALVNGKEGLEQEMVWS